MSGLLRKLRAVLGMALIWGFFWMAIALTTLSFISVFVPDSIGPGEGPADLGPVIGLVGFICGIVFGAVFSIIERRKPILELSLFRLAFWGFLVAGAFPVLAGKDFSQMLLVGALGTLSALASAFVARITKRCCHQSV